MRYGAEDGSESGSRLTVVYRDAVGASCVRMIRRQIGFMIMLRMADTERARELVGSHRIVIYRLRARDLQATLGVLLRASYAISSASPAVVFW